jgi:hypothetical protein
MAKALAFALVLMLAFTTLVVFLGGQTKPCGQVTPCADSVLGPGVPHARGKPGPKPRRPNADHLLALMDEDTRNTFNRILGECLAIADSHQPWQMARHVFGMISRRSNPSVQEPADRAAGFEGLDAATFSARLTRGFDHYTFAQEVSRRLVKWVGEVHESHGRPGPVDAPSDAHEHECWAMSEQEFQHGKKRRPRRNPTPEGHVRAMMPWERRSFLHICTADNKTAIWCTKYLLTVVTWMHEGRRVYYPAMFRIIPKLGDTPTRHAKAILGTLDALREVGVPVRSVLLDRWYDSHELRRNIRAGGYRSVTRMRINLAKRRIVWDVAAGTAIDLVKILEELGTQAKTSALEQRDESLDLKKKEWVYFKRSKPRVMLVRLEEHGPEVKLFLRAAVREVDGEWKLEGRLCSIIATDVDIEPELVGSLYPIRWVAELFLARLTEDKATDRPKRIEPEVVMLTGAVLWTGLMLAAQHTLLTQGRAHNLLGVPIERISKRAVSHILAPLIIPRQSSDTA